MYFANFQDLWVQSRKYFKTTQYFRIDSVNHT